MFVGDHEAVIVCDSSAYLSLSSAASAGDLTLSSALGFMSELHGCRGVLTAIGAHTFTISDDGLTREEFEFQYNESEWLQRSGTTYAKWSRTQNASVERLD